MEVSLRVSLAMQCELSACADFKLFSKLRAASHIFWLCAPVHFCMPVVVKTD